VAVEQSDLFESPPERALLDELLKNAQLYSDSTEYRDLIEFVARLRNFAPFNAMLLHIQKPGLSYAAYASDWFRRFDRRLKPRARPLLVLRPFGPVAFVYDVQDTEGKELPRDAFAFPAEGPVAGEKISRLAAEVEAAGFVWAWFDGGDAAAGSIQLLAGDDKQPRTYRVSINRNHSAATQFATVAHEFAHLFLGHLGGDKRLSIRARSGLSPAQRELEAESVAYIVCSRHAVTSRSESYLHRMVTDQVAVESLQLYQMLRAAGRVESFLGLEANGLISRPASTASQT
jgi:hypothetical protein